MTLLLLELALLAIVRNNLIITLVITWKVINSHNYLKSNKSIIFLSFVNLSSFHYKRHNQNKADKTKSRNKVECEADLHYTRCLQQGLEFNHQFPKKQLHPSQDNSKWIVVLFFFLSLILRLGEARESMNNAKRARREKIKNLQFRAILYLFPFDRLEKAAHLYKRGAIQRCTTDICGEQLP